MKKFLIILFSFLSITLYSQNKFDTLIDNIPNAVCFKCYPYEVSIWQPKIVDVDTVEIVITDYYNRLVWYSEVYNVSEYNEFWEPIEYIYQNIYFYKIKIVKNGINKTIVGSIILIK